MEGPRASNKQQATNNKQQATSSKQQATSSKQWSTMWPLKLGRPNPLVPALRLHLGHVCSTGAFGVRQEQTVLGGYIAYETFLGGHSSREKILVKIGVDESNGT